MKIAISDIAEATKATVVVTPGAHNACATGITWDSREVEAGWAYVAFPGERVDGHNFVEAAIDAGASVVVIMQTLDDAALDAARAAGAGVLQVADTHEALNDLAAYWRACLTGRVIGLTGSTGKTTTKNLVRDVLGSAMSVVATRANQNNEIGVPRTLLAAEADTAAVVVEMGMRGLGQIESLCAFAHPDWGIVTNVGESHIELLGSRENIARAKGELICALPDDGVTFINAADDYSLRALTQSGALERGVCAVFFDGSTTAVNRRTAMTEAMRAYPAVWAEDISFDEQSRPTFTLCASGFTRFGGPDEARAVCSLALRGLHNVSNATSAAAVGLALGMSLTACIEALSQAQPESGRQEMCKAACGAVVINDAYNANPDSMKAALSMLGALDVAGRRIAVLGDMGELGAFAPECHERVGAFCVEHGIDYLVCVGNLSRHIAQAAQAAGFDSAHVTCVDSNDRAIELVNTLLLPDDAVLVKASHAMNFEQIVKGLIG